MMNCYLKPDRRDISLWKVFYNTTTSLLVILYGIQSFLNSLLFRKLHINESKLFFTIENYTFCPASFKVCLIKYECINENIEIGRSYELGDILVSDCFFSRLTQFSGQGGVIYIETGTNSMAISFTMFFSCLSKYHGAISFYSLKSSLKMICASRCKCSLNGHFAYISASTTNEVIFLSLTISSDSTYGYTTFCMSNGNQSVVNCNSSMNQAVQSSGLSTVTPSSFISSFCNYANNKVLDYICINHEFNPGIMSFSNIIQNYGGRGVVRIYDGSLKIYYCIFKDNTNDLFKVDVGSFEVSHSFIWHTGFSSTGFNNSITNKQSYLFPFFKSHFCNADLPMKFASPENTPHLSPIETLKTTKEATYKNTNDPTIDFTIENTQKETLYRTYDNRCSIQIIKREITMIFSQSLGLFIWFV